MCGIWAIFGAKQDVKQLSAKCTRVVHRGPDAWRIESIHGLNNACLGFQRLTIIDSTYGMQPMNLRTYPHLWLIYDGEIYNYQKLQEEFGYNYETCSDGEAIIHSYAKFGVKKTVEMLDGVFAFVIVDMTEKTVHLGRDVFGIRPMFTFFDQGTLGICSEAKGLLNVPRTDGVLVQQFKPGHVQSLAIDTDGLLLWSESYPVVTVGGSDFNSVACLVPDDVYSNIRMLLKEAVKKRLISDRIGCFLSGGLDSSLVCALLAECMKEEGIKYPLQTFSIGMEGSPDIEAARILSAYLNTEHHEVKFTWEEGMQVIREVIYRLESYDTITIRGSIAMYLLSKYVKEKTDTIVMFSGEGSDELCQGYIHFHKAPSPIEADLESRRLLQDLYLQDVLRTDRMTAAHGLELRVPFLDKFFTSYFLSLSCEMRQPTNGVEKYLLRSAFSGTGLLPDEILWRPKEAFSDGVLAKEKLWYTLLQDELASKVSNDAVEVAALQFKTGVVPTSKEAYYFRVLFDEMFPEHAHFTPYHWMPKWTENASDPSPRALSYYKS
ncbi:asparagine synthetase [glutamine-hydrolyzing]-like [Corticium candelabrum]|uniref:asparagine synthetase [glutamine-hydrolyzing]-like n=1 Tax=Corticium candelabrum TaxID=121492 RepID=UPI002E26A521|nr:asparagine synthetase [glutamine-hydrolyzing]-like [Corticium candelabrum]